MKLDVDLGDRGRVEGGGNGTTLAAVGWRGRWVAEPGWTSESADVMVVVS